MKALNGGAEERSEADEKRRKTEGGEKKNTIINLHFFREP